MLEVLVLFFHPVYKLSTNYRQQVIAHLNNICRFECLVYYVKLTAELLHQILSVWRVAYSQIIWNASCIKICTKLLNLELAIFALIVFDRSVFAPVLLVFKKYLILTILINIRVELSICFCIRCLINTCRLKVWIVILQSMLTKANKSKHISFHRITLYFFVYNGFCLRNFKLFEWSF